MFVFLSPLCFSLPFYIYPLCNFLFSTLYSPLLPFPFLYSSISSLSHWNSLFHLIIPSLPFPLPLSNFSSFPLSSPFFLSPFCFLPFRFPSLPSVPLPASPKPVQVSFQQFESQPIPRRSLMLPTTFGSASH